MLARSVHEECDSRYFLGEPKTRSPKGRVTGKNRAAAPVATLRRSGSHGLDVEMTNDYIVVVEERNTLIRIGRALFGR